MENKVYIGPKWTSLSQSSQLLEMLPSRIRELMPSPEPNAPSTGWVYRVAEPYYTKDNVDDVMSALLSSEISSGAVWPRRMEEAICKLYGRKLLMGERNPDVVQKTSCSMHSEYGIVGDRGPTKTSGNSEDRGSAHEVIVVKGRLCPENSIFHKISQLRYAPLELFLVYVMKYFECLAYYAYAYIYVKYLSDDFGMTDEQAGYLYAGYGLFCSVLGLLAGSYIDTYGVRFSCIVGSLASLFARIVCTFTTSPFVACLMSLTLFPVGAALGIPVFALGIRRYSHPDIRAFAFTFFYLVFNLSMLSGGILINYTRNTFGETGLWMPFGILGGKMDWMRVVLLYCSMSTCVVIGCTFFMRDIEVDSSRPLKDRAVQPSEPMTEETVMPLKQIQIIAKQPRFWRLLWVTLIFCGVRSTFRHLDATFPKYFTREFGDDAPFELIIMLNPIIVMCVAPMATFMILYLRTGLKKTLMVGSLISSIAVFPLVISNTQASSVFFVILLSLGEVIWSPKLYEFSTMLAPKGQEGTYVAISGAPVYLATVGVGLTSGELLSRFCPQGTGPEGHHPRTLWGLVLLMALISPACLWYFQHTLLPKEDEDAAMGDSKGLGIKKKLSMKQKISLEIERMLGDFRTSDGTADNIELDLEEPMPETKAAARNDSGINLQESALTIDMEAVRKSAGLVEIMPPSKSQELTVAKSDDDVDASVLADDELPITIGALADDLLDDTTDLDLGSPH
eukprot:GEMP01005278.1.p1 GENE.GEMP01005278.1~~GEMP01005278.1.p1  ORF type:complete len:734 (+),score=92.77 GEMP01005278.1:59-2260(+)